MDFAVDVPTTPDFESVIGAHALAVEDLYGDTKTHVLTPNEKRDRPRDFRLDGYSGVLGIVGDNVEVERRWLAEAFAAEIRKLQEVYGDANVGVCWGVVWRYY